jgi:thioredoxin reductase (NADPH)
VPGVFVAGNVTDARATVMPAAASGLMAAGGVNADLIAEEARLAVAARSS